MKTIFQVLLALAMIIFGGLLTQYRLDQLYGFVDTRYEQFLEQIPAGVPFREIVAAAILVVGLIILLTLYFGRKKERSISFMGMHGEVTIELSHVESTLEAVAMKLPEVRKATIKLEPTDSPGRACVIANVELLKSADDDARLVTARVTHYIQLHTKRILGLSDVDVRLNVRRFKMIMKTLKLEPLLLEGPLAAAAGLGPAEAEATDPGTESSVSDGDETVEVGTGDDSGDEFQLGR